MTPRDPRAFEDQAEKTLTELSKALDAASADLDLECELAMGILSIEFSDGTTYVINSHRAAEQIWMAAEREAWHFDPVEGDWISTKTGEALRAALEKVLSKKSGKPVKL